ncbi:Heterokaryon incompatibility protein Het-C [Candidatus Electrothrix laxa]
MNIDKHRAISYCGFKRCHDLIPELQNNPAYRKTFYPLWMGNWLTDMNQATAFFSFLPSNEEPGLIRYWLTFLKKIHTIFPQDEWLKTYIDRKESELEIIARSGKKEKTDYYQSRKDGAYILPDFILQNTDFKKTWENLFATLWTEEWRSAEEAWTFSQKMGEMPESLPMDIPADKPDTPSVLPGKAEEIGAYYPLDHFDVTDQYVLKDNKRVLDNREELELKGHEERGFMTTTVKESLAYAMEDWVKKAFDTTQDADSAITRKNRLSDYQALKILGHGIHTLQDFYAHSNYSDLLLICMAEEKLLNGYWNRRIDHLVTETEVGTFNAFVLCKEHPDDKHGTGKKNPVVTGRFDTIDTVHTLLHLSGEGIHSHDNEAGHDDKEKKDRIFRLLFGTFSEIDVVQKMKGTVEAYRALAEQIDEIQEKIAGFFVDYLVDPTIKTVLREKEHLIDTYLLLKDATLKNDRTLQEYRKAGELLFHQHTIEDHLRKKITTAEQKGEMILPHHALLAKDHDQTNDAVKLSYKLSCALASEATTEVLVKYFQGASFSELEPLLKRRYVHPQFHTDQCAKTGSLNKAIESLNGKWFWYASKNLDNGQSILGFDTE